MRIKERARDWAVDYKPWDETLHYREYAAYGYEVGYKQALKEIKQVSAMHTDTNLLLGFAVGPEELIKRYFQDREGYGLVIKEISVINIEDPESVEQIRLKTEIKSLEKKLTELKKKVK